MGSRLFSIAANTCRETIRNKVLYVILAFGVLVLGLTFFLADLSMGELARIIADVGLSALHGFGVVMAVFLGITLVHREVERRTVYVVLSKPVPRWEFVVGKALGLGATLAITTAVMAAVLFAVHASYRWGGGVEPGILVASLGIYLELLLLVCLASLFSTFTTPELSAIFTLSAFLIGHLTGDLLVFGGRSESALVRESARALYFLLPNLEIFNWKNEVVYGGVPVGRVVPLALGYLLAYGSAVLVAACLLFSRKDFK